MTSAVSSLRIAIIGSGPSGFYAAEALQKAAPDIRIDLYDRLPTPFGLVRGGVAPDHPKIKSVTRIFDRVAARPGFRFRGNVHVGTDVTMDELRANYEAVIVAVGAPTDRHLDIPGEGLAGSHPATELVGWYNGHPDFTGAQFDLTQRDAAVVGLGNVAMDITRILLTPPDQLAATDIADHAVQALRSSAVQTIHILGRRGPVQAACTTPELRELGEIPGVDVVIDPQDLELDAASLRHLQEDSDRTAEKNLEVMRHWAANREHHAPRRIVFHFNVSPVSLGGSGRVESIRLMRNRLEADTHGMVRAIPTGTTFDLPVGLVFRSVGYRGLPVPGVPFDAARGVIPNINGRVTEAPGSATPIHALYTAGWIKRGPTGIIGTNKQCATDTIDHLFADAGAERLLPVAGSPDAVDALLAARGVRVTDWSHWQQLDAEELRRGAAAGKPRAKIVSITDMLGVIG